MLDTLSVDWQLCRPARRYYLWSYRSEDPLLIRIFAPEKMIDLNETASLVWDLLDGEVLAYHLIERLQDRYPEASRELLAEDLLRLLLCWEKDQLIYTHWEKLR